MVDSIGYFHEGEPPFLVNLEQQILLPLHFRDYVSEAYTRFVVDEFRLIRYPQAAPALWLQTPACKR